MKRLFLAVVFLLIFSGKANAEVRCEMDKVKDVLKQSLYIYFLNLF